MEKQKQNRRLADAVESAQYMGGISHWTMRDWAKKGKVSSFKIGARLMFDLDELDRIIAQGERPRLITAANAA